MQFFSLMFFSTNVSIKNFHVVCIQCFKFDKNGRITACERIIVFFDH